MEKTKHTKCALCQKEKECDLIHLGMDGDIMYLCHKCVENSFSCPAAALAAKSKIDMKSIVERLGGKDLGEVKIRGGYFGSVSSQKMYSDIKKNKTEK